MSSSTREHLLGYVLKALSPDEHEQVEIELDQNPSLRAELHRLESCIGQFGMTERADSLDPPVGLVARTAGEFHVPLPGELDVASVPQLKVLRQTMGGDYGYNFGYIDGGKLLRVCDSRRSSFALAGDAPSNSQPRRASGNHRGRGQN